MVTCHRSWSYGHACSIMVTHGQQWSVNVNHGQLLPINQPWSMNHSYSTVVNQAQPWLIFHVHSTLVNQPSSTMTNLIQPRSTIFNHSQTLVKCGQLHQPWLNMVNDVKLCSTMEKPSSTMVNHGWPWSHYDSVIYQWHNMTFFTCML
jgi:hypothetical protein